MYYSLIHLFHVVPCRPESGVRERGHLPKAKHFAELVVAGNTVITTSLNIQGHEVKSSPLAFLVLEEMASHLLNNKFVGRLRAIFKVIRLNEALCQAVEVLSRLERPEEELPEQNATAW